VTYRPTKNADHSVLSLRGAWPNTGTTYRLSRAHDANLDIGLADYGFIFDLKFETAPNGNVFVIKEAGAPLGFMIYTGVNGADYYIGVQMRNAAGGGIGHAGLWLPWKGRHIVTCFIDRDGLAYGRDNDDIGIQIGIDGNTNINQDNAGAFNMFLNDNSATPQQFGPAVLSFQFYNFGVGNGPTSPEIDAIHAQALSNPYSVPPLLAARVDYAVEQRMALFFENLDPAWNYVLDSSAYNLNPNIVGGALVSAAVKEYGSP